MRKYSITLVFSSWLDSCHDSARIIFSDCGSQLSQIWCRYQKFYFEVVLVDSRMSICHGVSTTWWGVYRISVIALLKRWCQSAAQMHSVRFPLISMLIGILSLPTFEYLHITELLIKSLHKVVPFMVDFSSLKLWMEIFNPITWISSSMKLWEQTH
jgi:hypothetical protein